MSYKIIQNDKVISVIAAPVWVTQLPNGSIIRCNLPNAIGVVSEDGSQTLHIAGAKAFSDTGREFEDVEAVYIEEAEAEELKTLLGLGASIGNDSDISWAEEDPVVVDPVPEEDESTLSEVKDRKIARLMAESRQVIYDGVDVALSDGTSEHFALGIDEQLDLITLYSLASAGIEQIPFHNSTGECKYYSGEDILRIINAANKLKMYHAAYMDSLKKWILSLSSISEIGSVNYGDTIPSDYHTEVYLDIIADT